MTAPVSRPRPAWLRIRSDTMRRRVVLAAAAAGSGLLAAGGLYPQFDGGSLAPLLGALAAAAALVVVRIALRAARRRNAVLLTLVLSAALGLAVPIVPAFLLTLNGNQLGAALAMGLVLGGPMGLAYGVPLAFLIGSTLPHLQARSHAADHKLVRGVCGWLALVALAAMAGALYVSLSHVAAQLEVDLFGYFTTWMLGVCALVFLFASAMMVRAQLQLWRAERWGAEVKAGVRPGLRARRREAYEPLRGLPRVSDGAYVVEQIPPDATQTTAYRGNDRYVPVCFL